MIMIEEVIACQVRLRPVQRFGFWVLGFGFWVLGFRSWALGLRF